VGESDTGGGEDDTAVHPLEAAEADLPGVRVQLVLTLNPEPGDATDDVRPLPVAEQHRDVVRARRRHVRVRVDRVAEERVRPVVATLTFHSGRFCESSIRYRLRAAASLTMNDALSRYCFGSEKIAVTSAEYVNAVALPTAAVTVVMFDAVADDRSPCGWPVPDPLMYAVFSSTPIRSPNSRARNESRSNAESCSSSSDTMIFDVALFAPSVT
jgi:hypothetical protein